MACSVGRDVYLVKVGNVNLVFEGYQSLTDIMDLIDEQSFKGTVTIKRAISTTYKSA